MLRPKCALEVHNHIAQYKFDCLSSLINHYTHSEIAFMASSIYYVKNKNLFKNLNSLISR